jgi:hypothetical protein
MKQWHEQSGNNQSLKRGVPCTSMAAAPALGTTSLFKYFGPHGVSGDGLQIRMPVTPEEVSNPAPCGCLV